MFSLSLQRIHRCKSSYSLFHVCSSSLTRGLTTRQNSIVHHWPTKPTWSVTSTLLPSQLSEETSGTESSVQEEDKRVLDRMLRLACLDTPANTDTQRYTQLNRELTSLRHFVKHVQDADIPANTTPLVRLCETPRSADNQRGHDTSINTIETNSAEECNRTLLRHVATNDNASTDTLIHYNVPAPPSHETSKE